MHREIDEDEEEICQRTIDRSVFSQLIYPTRSLRNPLLLTGGDLVASCQSTVTKGISEHDPAVVFIRPRLLLLALSCA